MNTESFEKTDLHEAWKRWSEKPGNLTPEQAAAAVRDRIQPQPRVWIPRWAYATAALMVLLLLPTVWRWRASPDATTTPAIGRGEVLMWLDEQTPLYMTFQSPNELSQEETP